MRSFHTASIPSFLPSTPYPLHLFTYKLPLRDFDRQGIIVSGKTFTLTAALLCRCCIRKLPVFTLSHAASSRLTPSPIITLSVFMQGLLPMTSSPMHHEGLQSSSCPLKSGGKVWPAGYQHNTNQEKSKCYQVTLSRHQVHMRSENGLINVYVRGNPYDIYIN